MGNHNQEIGRRYLTDEDENSPIGIRLRLKAAEDAIAKLQEGQKPLTNLRGAWVVIVGLGVGFGALAGVNSFIQTVQAWGTP